MIRNAVSSVVLALCALTINASAALAQGRGGSDPTQVGDNVKSIISPNAKALWWCVLVVGLIYAAASQKRGRAASIVGGLALAGIVIYNPAGVGSFMQGIATRIV